MSQEVLMTLSQVSKTYLMGEVKVEALKPTSLEILSGELLIILGPSGSGKSTLLNMIGGMDRPTEGVISFLGRNLSQAADRELTMYRRRDVGFVFQFYNLIPDLTAEENVSLAAETVENPLSAIDVLDWVGLAKRKDHFPSQLSGGEQQRVAIARAIVKKPSILLCDEPTGALDYQTGKLILELLLKVNRDLGSTVIIVSHNMVIGDMGDRVVRMRSGLITDIINNPEPVSPERIEW